MAINLSLVLVKSHANLEMAREMTGNSRFLLRKRRLLEGKKMKLIIFELETYEE